MRDVCFLLVAAVSLILTVQGDPLPQELSEPLSKRGWSSFGGGYGKRAALDDDYQEALDEVDKEKWNYGSNPEDEETELAKRAWNSNFGGGMGKRAWNSNFSGGMGKRAWNSNFSGGVGKRAWNSEFSGGMGKRAWNSNFSGGLGKRAWNEFSGGIGKRSKRSAEDVDSGNKNRQR